MSSQKESLKKKIFKKSMFAASAAMILASTSALGTANRNVIAGDTILSGGTNLDGAGGVIQFTQSSFAGFQQNIISDIDFNSSSAQVTIGHGKNVGGATGENIDHLLGENKVTLNFVGNSVVSKDIEVATINAQGINFDTLVLQKNVTVEALNFTAASAAGRVQIGGSLTTPAGGRGVTFGKNAAGGTLTFNGAVGGENPANYTFASPIVNGGNGTLNVQTKLTATNSIIGTLKAINIGSGGFPQTFTIAVNASALNLLAVGGTVAMGNDNSTFVLAPAEPQTVTFNGNLNSVGGGGGIVNFDGTNALVVQGTGGVKIGNGVELDQLNIIGKVTVSGGVTTKLDVSGTDMLNIKAGSTFTDESVTSVKVAAINIGEVEGAATYILDAVNDDFALDTGGISFKNAASVLQLASSDARGNDRRITINADLNPGGIGKGIVALNSATAGEVLTIDGKFKLGIAGDNTLNSVTFAGKGNITVIPTINAANPLSVGLEGDLILRNVNAGITYTAGTNLTVDDVNGNVDFKGQATATLNLTANSMITGAVDSTGGVGGKLNLAERIVVDGVIGGTKSLTAVNFNGTGINLTKVSNAKLFTVSDRANVSAYRLMTGDVTIEGNGILSAEGRVAGNVAAGGGTFKGNVTGSGSVGVNGDFTGNVSTSATIAGGDFTGNVGTTVTFKGEGTLTTGSVGDLTDFAGKAGTVNVKDTGTLAGVTSSDGNFIGNLNFAGDANVTEGVSNIGAITLNGANGKIVNFQQDVSAASLSFTDAGTANLLGSLTTTGEVDFGVSGGTLELSGLVGDANPANHTFNSIIANGETGILTVNTTLTATKSDIGKVKTINIGNAKTFTVDASAGAVNLLQAAGSTITFGDAKSVFRLTTNTAQTVTFNNSLNGGAGNTGIVNLNGNGNTLTLASNKGAKTLGGANKLAELNVSGAVTISGADTKLDVSNVAVLNLAPASVFTDKSLTSAKINEINIGVDGANGKATYVLDAVNAPIIGAIGDLPGSPEFTLNASGVNFANPDSVLRLQSTAPAGVLSTIQLMEDLAPAAGTGIVELNSANEGATLIIYGQEKSFGTALKPLKQLIFSGEGLIVVSAKTFTPEILLNVAAGLTDYVTSNITYATNTEFEVGNVTGNMDFANQAGTAIFTSIILGESAQITGNITSTGGSNGTVEFVDNGIIGTVGATTITNLKMLKAGADNSTVTINSGGNMSIDEIQGIGTGTIVFAANTKLTGDINITGGKAVNLTFTNGGTISGDVGTGAKIGDIVLQGGETTFFGKGEGNTLYIVPGNGAKLDSRGEFNFKIVIGSPPTPHAFHPAALVTTVNDTLWIAHSDKPEIYQGDIASADMPLKAFQVDGSDITFLDTVYINNLNFTTPNSVTTNFKGIAQIGEATTIGNKIHTIAISNDVTTGTSSFGSESNPLKTIQFLTDSTFTANSPSIYSTITTNTNNTGTVVFNADNGFTDDLGDSNTSLNTVQFRSVKGTVKGDTYSQNISIDSGKSAIFTGYTSRKLSVADAKVNGVFVPRSIKEFNYKTKIVADNFTGADASSSGTFSNAALIQSPIKGGSFKFEDDVWLQKPLTGVDSVTFAPKKISIIQSNLEAKKIIADQATLMFIDNNLALKGDVTGSNITLDLGNNQVTYTGNAAPSGELTINVFYDVTNSGTSNNTGSGNIVIAEGSNIDLSGVTALKILLTAPSSPNSISENSAYPIITSLSGNGITLGNAANLPFNVTTNEGVFVRWVINSASLTLYPVELTGDVAVDNIIKKSLAAPLETDTAKLADVIIAQPDQVKVISNRLVPIIPLPSNEIHRITRIRPPFIMPAVEIGRDTGIGSSGVSSGAASTGATTTNPNDGFNAARGNTNAGTKDVSDRTSKIRDAENASDSIAAEQEQDVSRRGGAAVGAGDCDSNKVIYGLWGSPYFGKATQKQQNNLMGYKLKSAGGSIGLDTAINDNIVLGAAYTKVDTKLNYQDAKIGNNTKINTNMFSVYGLYNFINNWFVEGITSYSRSIIKTNEVRNIINGTETAHAKYRSYSYSGQVVGGYNYLWNETTLSPMVGLRLAKMKDSGYHEFGTSFQNLTIKKRQYNKFEGIVGGEIKTTFYKGGFLIKPQVHAFINYDFKGKTPSIVAELDEYTNLLTVPTAKATKTLYDLGAGVELKKGRMEYGLHYGLNLARKYQAQSGTVKVKMNF
ncbi:autotransporter domain-containing protein [Rickettsia endosymbiont of Polydrusus tereticollis]|uniref:autotransporter domain-containing protein n=1 Tax=Rickettsia endosymbiont of Polydrusus tereticollis TaxID=3066251 RepID=UPI003132E653